MVFERLGQDGTTTGPTAYVHCKLTIVDDVTAVVGSANTSNRSWSHDSEIMVTYFDSAGPGGLEPESWRPIRSLRADLWEQHLNVPGNTGPPMKFGDPGKARLRWLDVWQAKEKGHVQPYDWKRDVARRWPEVLESIVVDPKGR